MTYAPKPAYPELVEGLLFTSCHARCLKNKDSASTSSAWTGLVVVEAHRG